MPTSEEPVYRRLAGDLLRQIQKGQVTADGFIASEHELVRRYGVSRDTVRRASAHLIEGGHVVRYPGKGLYIRQKYAERRQTIWIIADNLTWAPSIRLCQGAKEFARQAEWDVQVSDGHGEQETNIRLLKQIALDPDQIDGIILMAWHKPTFFELAFEMKKTGIPIVIVDHHVGELRVASVAADNYEGGYLAGTHFVKHGHRKIAFIGDTETSTVRCRLDGFRDALGDHHIPLPRKYIATIAPTDRFSDWTSDVIAAFDKLPKNGSAPTALFCSCDAIARILYRHCDSKRIRIPRDLSLIGFDDDPLAQWLTPPLTTVSQNFDEIGRCAMEVLRQQIENQRKHFETVTIPVQLIKRNSVNKIKS